MTENLQGRRILVVEDEYVLADELQKGLCELGAHVLGPVGMLDNALDLIHAETCIDGAIIDINLGSELAYPAADLLIQRGVPLVFTTGYDASSIPSRYEHIVRCEKPVAVAKVLREVAKLW